MTSYCPRGRAGIADSTQGTEEDSSAISETPLDIGSFIDTRNCDLPLRVQQDIRIIRQAWADMAEQEIKPHYAPYTTAKK
ncbi:hypothetical protein A2U01_0061931 [Trifolium medium]|uniref:Uncharacterized protein n=1 Tax=Trifolium medium TaxID=97028 RepID=A0A392RVP6_9FABA|nr:hypothetical protein [Trifolium medium]